MTDKLKQEPIRSRVQGDVPIVDANTAAAKVSDDATVLTSGFGSVGYPKQIPLTLADSGRDLSLTVVSSGSVGEEIDVHLVEAGAIERRFAYQSTEEARKAANRREVAFSDRNVSQLGDEVQYGNELLISQLGDSLHLRQAIYVRLLPPVQ